MEKVTALGTKDTVLELLEKRRGESISGEELAQRLDISRTAVWKAIKELRAEGYHIRAGTNKGYCMSRDTDILSVQGILPHLPQKDWNIHVFPTLESTNQTAKLMALQGAEHGRIIIADTQTEGRGRWGRAFYSPGGTGIYLSMIMRPTAISLAGATLVTAAASVAVCRGVRGYTGQEAEIKWVNDIFLKGKKVGGILTEAITDFETGSIDWIILGVGLNFSTEEFPAELEGVAGSIAPGSRGARNEMIAGLILHLSELLAQREFGGYLKEYRSRSMVLGKAVTVQEGAATYPALAERIDEQGFLLVRLEDGTTKLLSSGEVTIRP